MTDPTSPSRGRRSRRRTPGAGTTLAAAVIGAFLAFGDGSPAGATDGAPRTDSEAVGADTPIGRVEYHPGRGLQLGDTRVTVGGFATAEANRFDDGDAAGGLEGVNFFLFFDPLPFVHAFTELETGEIVGAASDEKGLRSSLELGVERAYGDFGASDAANLRFGKFLTPIGRWNPVPAEPLTWTASEPILVDQVFDESMTGAMAFGRTFPRGGAFSYSLYGTFLDPLNPDPDAPPARRSAGTYLEWASLGGWSVGASYFASEARSGGWHHLGGVDGLWRPTGRVEITVEALAGEGSRTDGALGGFYAQGVVETVRSLYLVGRYEHFDPAGDDRSIDLFDVGLAWVPRPYLRLKADYGVADHPGDAATPGFQSSFSLLF